MKHDFIQRLQRKLLCLRGGHKTEPQIVSLSKGAHLIVSVRFLQCPICGIKFFSSAADRKKYEYYKKSKRQQTIKLLLWRSIK